MLTNKLPINVKTFISLLNELSQRDKQMLIDRFEKGLSLKQVAKKNKISDSRAKQIEDKLIKHIDLEFDLNNFI